MAGGEGLCEGKGTLRGGVNKNGRAPLGGTINENHGRHFRIGEQGGGENNSIQNYSFGNRTRDGRWGTCEQHQVKVTIMQSRLVGGAAG